MVALLHFPFPKQGLQIHVDIPAACEKEDPLRFPVKAVGRIYPVPQLVAHKLDRKPVCIQRNPGPVHKHAVRLSHCDKQIIRVKDFQGGTGHFPFFPEWVSSSIFLRIS
jgi:hypothetical protein